MKKFFVFAVLCCFVVLPVMAASYTNNTYQKQAREYNRKAQEAFDGGEYDLAVEYAKSAEEYSALSEAYIRMMMARSDAQQQLDAAKEKLDWAKSVHADRNYAAAYETALQSYDNAVAAFGTEQYEEAGTYASAVLAALGSVKDSAVLPKYYVVRPWTESKDCFWNIAGRPYVYGDTGKWKELYKANKSRLPDPSNPDLLKEGIILEIPSLSGEFRDGTYDPNVVYE